MTDAAEPTEADFLTERLRIAIERAEKAEDEVDRLRADVRPIEPLVQAARVAHQRLVYAGDHAADLHMQHRAEMDWGAAARLLDALKPFQESCRD